MSEQKFEILGGPYIVTQSTLLFAHYGLKYAMPWWVRWFPTVAIVAGLCIVGLIVLFIAIVSEL